MGWGTRRWQDDEDVIANAQQNVQGTSDDDVIGALAFALAQENARQGGDD